MAEKLIPNPSLYRFRGKPYTITKMEHCFTGCFAWLVFVYFEDPQGEETIHCKVVNFWGWYFPCEGKENDWDVVRKEVKNG